MPENGLPTYEVNVPGWYSSSGWHDFTFNPPLASTPTPTIPKQIIGVDINIVSEDITKLLAYPAKKKIEVRVTIDGNTKEFTLDEFKKRLFGGFQGTFVLKE